MKTAIIPQIKSVKITADKNDANSFINLCDFKVSNEILELLPIAKDIFSLNKQSETNKNNPQHYISYTKIEPINNNETKLDYYEISIKNDSIEIKSPDKKGLMFGLFTISELGLINDDKLSFCEIYDEPALNMRGFSDDISRGQISTTQNFFDIIKRLARYKYNTFMPYIEDVFAFTNIKAWGKYSSPIQKDEWKAIINFAKEYQMEVRPIINLLGHFD
ncbi:MAG: hypothetical protein RSA99_03620, partial [Oscillospiraceae bacterium]